MKTAMSLWIATALTVAVAAGGATAHAQLGDVQDDSAGTQPEVGKPLDTRLNFALGLGIGIAPGMTQGASAAIMTVKAGSLVYSLRYAHSTEVNILGGATDSETDIAILAGPSTADPEGSSAALQIGIAYTMADVVERVVDELYYQSYRTKGETTIGFAYQAQLYYRHIGIVAFGNTNSAASFGGALLCVRFGDVF